MDKRLVVITGILAVALLGTLAFNHQITAPKDPNPEESKVEEVSYIIYKDGGMYKAKNGTTGTVDYYGTNAGQVIQSALNALTSGRTWKEKVLLKGDFSITATIFPSSYTTIVIDGELTTPSNSDVNIFDLDTVEEVDIFGGILNGNRGAKNTNVAHNGIYIRDGSKNIVVQGVHAHDFHQNGIVTTGPQRVEDIKILNCVSWNNGRQGLYLSFAKEALVDNFIGHNNGWYGLLLGTIPGYSDCPKTIVSNCLLYSNSGPDLEKGRGLGIRSNDVIVKNTHIYDNQHKGLVIESGERIIIEGCSIYNSGQSGIDAHSSETTIKNCLIYNNDYIGIASDGDRVEIIGCTIRSNVKSGIRVYGEENIIKNNIVLENGEYGISTEHSASDGIISGNIVKSNSKAPGQTGTYHGIRIHNGINFLITENRCFDDQAQKTQGYGIKETGTSNYNIIMGNNCIGNLYGGIQKIGWYTKVWHNLP